MATKSNKVVGTTRSAAQQAELDRLRAEKETAQTVQPEVLDKESIELKIQRMLAASLPGFEMPSWKRMAAATLATVVVAAGAGTLIGKIAGLAMVAIYMLTGSAMLSYLIMLTALLLSLYVGLKIGQHVGNYVLSGQIDRDVITAKNKVVGWFGVAKSKVMPAKIIAA